MFKQSSKLKYFQVKSILNLFLFTNGSTITGERSRMRRTIASKRCIANGLLAISIICAILLFCEVIMVDARSPINVMAMKWWKDNKPTKLKPRQALCFYFVDIVYKTMTSFKMDNFKSQKILLTFYSRIRFNQRPPSLLLPGVLQFRTEQSHKYYFHPKVLDTKTCIKV